MTSAPLALRFEAPAAYGSNAEVNAIVERMSALMPTRLADWQLKPGYIEKAEKNLNSAFYKTAQLAIFYRLVPSQDIHILPFGNDFVVDMGIEAWRKSADRYCATHQITYHVHTEEMSIEELKKRRGKLYDPEDVGAVAYLWRSDKENVYQIFGAKESMSRACGVWAKKAKEVSGKWQSDTIPAQRSKQDVAKRRATKAVLKMEFSLDSLLAATPAELRQNLEILDSDARAATMRKAIPASRVTEVDENGFIVIEPEQQKRASQDVEFVVADEPEMEDGPVMADDRAQAMDEQQEDDVDYLALFDQLEGNALTFAKWTKTTHINSNGPASDAQYRYLVGVINGITECEGSHRQILGTLIGRAVHSGSPPGRDLCGKLLEWLPETKTDKETGEMLPNPAHRADYAECIKAIWYMIRGQLSLFDSDEAA